MHIDGLTVHPLKSARGLSVDRLDVAPGPLPLDRAFVVVDASGRIVTQRERPELARLAVGLDSAARHLTLTAPGVPESLNLTIDLADEVASDGTAPEAVRVWSRDVPGVDTGDAAARWISRVLGRGHRLVRAREARSTPSDPGRHFVDDAPILAISRASLDHLSSAAGISLSSTRFRPNIVVAGGRPYDEDRWDALTIGSVTFRALHACARCVLTTADPETLERGPEPLRTLAATRRVGNDVIFGRYLVATHVGVVAVGDPVVIERWRDTPAPA